MDLCACESEEHEYRVGAGVNTSVIRYTIVNRSHKICHKGKGLVAKKNHGPLWMWERGEWSLGWGGCWCEYYSVVRYTIVKRSRTMYCRICQMYCSEFHEWLIHWDKNKRFVPPLQFITGPSNFLKCETSVIPRWSSFLYYESIKHEVKRRPIYEWRREWRCDERLKSKAEGS